MAHEDSRSRLNTAVLVISGVAGVISPLYWLFGDHFKTAEHERRIDAIEVNQKWQNEMLYRIDENVKTLKETLRERQGQR